MSEGMTIVTVSESGDGNYIQNVTSASHSFVSDAPLAKGGQDKGPAPYDLLLAALGSCTTITLRMYADRKNWPLESVSVKVTHKKHELMGNDTKEVITRDITLHGKLDDEQRARLLDIANKCPVHKTLTMNTDILSRLEQPAA